jgi:MarR-like DNA-binding transcriptional regulator SgrR of sgrS sRNA
MTRPLTGLVVLLGLATPARAYLPPSYGGVVTVTLPDRPLTLDPAKATRESELQLITLLYDRLYQLDHLRRPRPHLVAFHEKLDNGRTWRLHLRHNVLLHDGQPLTGRQVVDALRRLKRGPNQYLLGPVSSVNAPQADLIEIKLTRAANLPLLLSAPAASVAVQRGKRLLGSGPFTLRGWRSAQITLAAHRQHFAGRPYIDELRFKIYRRAAAQRAAFQVGQLQLSFHGTSSHGSQPLHPFTALESRVAAALFLRVGSGRSYLSDPQFRLALLKGIDRDRLRRVAGTGRGSIAAGPVARALARRRTRPVKYDKPAAIRLLAKLVQRNDELRRDALSTGKLKFSLLVDASRFEDQAVAGQLVADLDRIGITTTIDAQPAQEYQKRLAAGRFQLALCRQALQLPDLKIALAGAFLTAGRPGVAKACLTHRRCIPKKTRLFNKLLPALPLVHTSTRIFHDSRLGGLRISRVGRISYAEIYRVR